MSISAEEQIKKMKEYHSNYQKNRMHSDPDFKQKHKERCKIYHNDEKNKEKIKEQKLNYYYREKAKKLEKDLLIQQLTIKIEKLEMINPI